MIQVLSTILYQPFRHYDIYLTVTEKLNGKSESRTIHENCYDTWLYSTVIASEMFSKKRSKQILFHV